MTKLLKPVGLGLFASSMFISTALANIGLVLLILCACLQYRDVWQTIKRQPLFYVSIAFILYLLIRQAIGYVYPGGSLADISSWVYLSLFWIPGWALGNQQKHWRWFLLLALFGFILRLIIGFDADRICMSLVGKDRFVFHETAAALGFALYTANIILGWVVWKKQLLDRFRFRWLLIATVLWLLVLLLLMQVMVLANSRGTFLAILCSLVFLFIFAFYKSRNKTNTLKITIWATLILVGLITMNYDTVKQRFAEGSSTYQAIIQGQDLQNIPYSSSGLRIHFYAHVIDMIKQRPWFGWGAGSNQWLMEQSNDPRVKAFPHSHSGYFDVLSQLGWVGGLFFLLLVIVLARGFYSACTTQKVDIEFVAFLSSSVILMIVWNVFNVRLEHVDYRFYSLFIMALAFAVINHPGTKK